MAYSATSRIIHKWFINVNPYDKYFWEYFARFWQIDKKALLGKDGIKGRTGSGHRKEYADARRQGR